MLLVGDHKTIPISDKLKVYNLSSPIEGYIRTALFPNYVLNNMIDAQEFDNQYAEWVLNNSNQFICLMTIMMDLYYGFDVYLIVKKNDEFCETISESLMKLIQQRYGYNYFIINEQCDLEMAYKSDRNESSIGYVNGQIGVQNFMRDKEIYNVNLANQMYGQ